MLMKNKLILAIITILIITGIFYSGYKMHEISQKTNEEFSDSTPESIPMSYVFLHRYSPNENIDYVDQIFAFDENDQLVDSRLIWEFSTEEIAQENYQNWVKARNLNLSIKGKTVYFNEDMKLKDVLDKESILAQFSDPSKYEITEY